MDTLFTVVIPAYNIESYIRPCVDSVLASVGESKDTEILIVDDGSTDDTGRAADDCAARDGRVRVIHQANQGASAARNNGIKAAKGKYCIFVDGDDTMLAAAVPSYRQCVQSGADVAVGRYETADGKGRIEQAAIPFDEARSLPVAQMYEKIGCPTAPWVFCIRTQFLMDNELFFESGIFPYEDDEWGARMFFAAHKVVLNDAYCYLYRIGRSGSGTTVSDARYILYNARVPVLQWQKFHDKTKSGIYGKESLAAAEKYVRQFYAALCVRSRDFVQDENYKQLLQILSDATYILKDSPNKEQKALFFFVKALGMERGTKAFCAYTERKEKRCAIAAQKKERRHSAARRFKQRVKRLLVSTPLWKRVLRPLRGRQT